MEQVQDKNNTLRNQVQEILTVKGYGSIFFNFTFEVFKKQTAKAFNQAQDIADLFIEQSQPYQSDFSNYCF